jgi:hypothetical protein
MDNLNRITEFKRYIKFFSAIKPGEMKMIFKITWNIYRKKFKANNPRNNLKKII